MSIFKIERFKRIDTYLNNSCASSQELRDRIDLFQKKYNITDDDMISLVYSCLVMGSVQSLPKNCPIPEQKETAKRHFEYLFNFF
jgi:hypothetical protein